VSVMGTPSYHELIVPAELDLAELADKRMVVFVEQPGYISANVNMRFYLTEAINSSLRKHVGIPDANLAGYDQIAEFRAANSDWSVLSAVEIGSRMGAGLVLQVYIEDLRLDEAGEAGYLKGRLNTQVALFEVSAGKKLWPESDASRKVRVGFEIEDKGWDVAVVRLAVTSAHCTTRYLYDCKKKAFRISDDRSTVGWENWQD
jgi:hypothetical protein